MNEVGGKLIIFSGPSGAGKTTVVRQLLTSCPRPLVLSVSATTRPARPGETDGVDYHFMQAEEFQQRRQQGEFLECFEVFGRGYWYGTLKQAVQQSRAEGNWVVLEIDVNGMQQVVDQFPDAITIFIRPESLQELERRLRGRGTETEATIQRRLEVAQEFAAAGQYQHDIVNHTVDQAVHDICQLLCHMGDP